MTLPDWYALVLLSLAAWRCGRLAGWDTITAGVRERLTGLTDNEHAQWAYLDEHLHDQGHTLWDGPQGVDRVLPWKDWAESHLEEATGEEGAKLPPLVPDWLEDDVPHFSRRRWYFSKLVRCPWCISFWMTIPWWASYEAFPHSTLIMASLFAAWGLAGLIGGRLDQ